MAEKKEELVNLVGAANVLDDPGALEDFSRDKSFAPAVKVRLAVKPGNLDEVQKVIRWANSTKTPLVPVSSGGPHFRGDTVPSVGGTVVLDLTRMQKIIRINRRNRMTIIQPGVTFGQLIPELAKEGLRLSMPLLPRADKSVTACYLEREPILNPRYHWELTEPLRSLEIVWGNGDKTISGDAGDHFSLEEQWEHGLAQNYGGGPFQVDYYRLVSAAQGTMGVVTWASIKCEIVPKVHNFYLVPAAKLESLTPFVYRLLHMRYGDELFVLNGAELAYILGAAPDEIKARRNELPAWVAVVGIAGREWLPEERVAFQEKDITDLAQSMGLKLQNAVPGARSGDLRDAVSAPSPEPFWKLRYKGASQDIFFLTTLDKVKDFVKIMQDTAEAWSYPANDIGIYIQPIVQGVNAHVQFDLPYDPASPAEVKRIQGLFAAASDALLKGGAFFSRPYGIWASMAYGRDAQSTIVLKKLKNIFDPANVMNPGKLCF